MIGHSTYYMKRYTILCRKEQKYMYAETKTIFIVVLEYLNNVLIQNSTRGEGGQVLYCTDLLVLFH
jgi:hypothetical protein